MDSGAIMRHRDNPQEYCNRVTKLIENKDNQWQDVWKAGINELFEGSSYSITYVNSLLKVIEKAFKERMYSIRAQAFECWQLFIIKVEKHSTSSNPEKLLNVILIPLCASNHSMKNVLDAKLNTWLTLMKTEVLSESIARDKVIPNLLKILYGPHSLATACTYEDLSELCVILYSILIEKYLKYDESDLVLSYLEKAIPAANLAERSRSVGQKVWTDVLDYISANKWPTTKLNYLMKTLENLLMNNKGKNNSFLYALLLSLVCKYDLPSDSLIRHLGLVIRCMLSSASSDSDLISILQYVIKRCYPKEHLLFDKIHKILTESPEEYDDKLRMYWTAVVSCFCKWNKRSADYDHWDWILLFPVKHLHDKWNQTVQENLQNCFENVSSVVDHDILARNLSRRLNTFLNNSETAPVSLLNAATCLCRTILQKSKPSNVSSIKELLLTIYEKKPAQTSGDSPNKSFAPKYVTCVLYFVENYPDYGDDFAPIIRNYSQLVDVNKDAKKFPIVQLMSKYTNKNSEDSENIVPVLKATNGVSNNTTPGKSKIRSSFSARLSSADKRNANSDIPFTTLIANSPKSSVSTPRSQVPRNNEDEVQFIAITPRSKNSPMTEHQKEIAKEKSYIPALYEDLSQSQSQSQTDSMRTLLSKKGQAVVTPCPDFTEENANPPSANADSADEVPASFNFRDAITKAKSSHGLAVKKSLFNNHSATPLDHNDNTAVVPVPPKGKPDAANIEYITCSGDDDLPVQSKKQPPKRKSLRIESNKPVESEPPKRSKLESKIKPVEEADKTQQQKNDEPTTAIQPADKSRRSSSRRSVVQSNERKQSDSDIEIISASDSESQNLFVCKAIAPTSSPAPSLMDVKNSAVHLSSRKKSLRRSKTNTPPPCRSPISMRKRKNSLPEAPISSKKVASSTAVPTLNQAETATEEAKTGEKLKNVHLEGKDSGEPAKQSSKQDSLELSARSEESSASSVVTVISAETPRSTESGRQADVSQTSQAADSVIIIEEEVCEIITIDSQPDDITPPAMPNTPVVEKSTETVDQQEESTFLDSTQTQSETNKKVVAEPEKAVAETEKVPETRSGDVSLALEVSQMENNTSAGAFVCVAKEVPTHNKTPTKETNKASVFSSTPAGNCIVVEEAANEKTQIVEEERIDQVSKNKETSSSSSPTEASAETREGGDSETETVVVANESVKTNNISNASPLTNNSRTSQMLKMVFGSQHNMTKPKSRGSRSNRNSITAASPAASANMSNGTPARTAANSRTLKILQANGHVESPAKPSPSNNLTISEKMEKFRYTPKECTSPGILKRPNTNGNISPKSPKSVNFAEQLTNTREYQVDENYSDSWSGSDQSNNLVSDEEGTSQDTLYPVLQNCNDDIKQIAERLNLNKQQLDTFRRMGIETVGQLASASTIVGKSIPVGDNRVQRLRSALKAYDNDRKLKGLRTPSVRRKILYKSQNQQLDVSSIIEILDDAEEPVTETGPELEVNPADISATQALQPTVIIERLMPEVPKSNQCSPTKASPPSTVPSFSPMKTPTDAATSYPSRLTRSQLSPMKSTSQSSPLKSISQSSPMKSVETVPSSPIRFTRSLLSSPLKSGEVSSLSPSGSLTQSQSSPCGASGSASSPPANVARTSPPSKACRAILCEASERISSAKTPSVEKQTVIKTCRTSDVIDTVPATRQQQQPTREKELVCPQNKKADGAQPATPAPLEESATEQDVNDDADFICTNDEIILNNNLNLRSYPKLVKAKNSMALLRTPSKGDLAADLLRTASPEIVSVEMNESTAASTQESLGAKELEASGSKNVSLSEEQHSMSIFSPDITKDGGVEEEDESHSLIEGSLSSQSGFRTGGVSCVSQEGSTTSARFGSRIELRLEGSDDDAPRSRTGESLAYELFAETLKTTRNGIERIKAQGIVDDLVDKEAKLLFDSLKRFYD